MENKPVLNNHQIADMLDLALSIRNRCNALLALKDSGKLSSICCTLIEDNLEDAQKLVDDYCVKEG